MRPSSPDKQGVSSNSMSPLVFPGDIPVVKKAKKYKENDLAAFVKGKRLVVHRVVFAPKSKDYLILKGDNNQKSDGKVSLKQVLGRVEQVRRNGKTVDIDHLYLAQSSSYFEEIRKFSKEFKVDYVVLKGLPLHLKFLNESPKRLYFDIDILINKKDLERAKGELKKLGFKEAVKPLFAKKQKPTQISLVKEKRPFPVIIDLHTEPAIALTQLPGSNKLVFNLEEFQKEIFKGKRKINMGGVALPVLDAEILFTYLLLHLFHHNFKGMHRMRFIAQLASKNPINWNKLAIIINKHRFNNFIFPALLITQKYTDLSIPLSFKNRIKPKPFIVFLAKATSQLTNPFNRQRRVLEGLRRLFLLLLLSPVSVRTKIGFLTSRETIGFYLPTIKSAFFKSAK